MQKKQCRDALEIYKRFLARMERCAEFLKVAEVEFCTLSTAVLSGYLLSVSVPWKNLLRQVPDLDKCSNVHVIHSNVVL